MASDVAIALGCLVLAATLSGCDGGASGVAGHYEGFLVAGTLTEPTQVSISADAQTISSRELKVQLSPEPTGAEMDFDIQFASGSTNGSGTVLGASDDIEEVRLSPSNAAASAYFPQGQPLQLEKSSGGCFSGGGNELCIGTGSQISMRFALAAAPAKFVLEKIDPAANQPSPVPSLEAPQSYSVDQLVSRAETRSYNSEIEFENVIQAKLNAQSTYLNLLPHINIGSILDLNGFVTTTMVRAIGDLLPFFLPDRWFLALEEGDLNDSEFDSYRVVQKDSMNVVQGLAYSALRDEQALQAIEQNRVSITEIRDEILASEQSGGGVLQVGSSDDVTSALDTLVGSIDALKENIHEELTSLSQAAGFMNPGTVSGVLPIPVSPVAGPIGGAVAGSETDFENDAVNRSLELKQLADMTEAMQLSKKASYFQWLDPSGVDQGSLGFGTIDYIEIGSAQIQQLQDKWSDTRSELLQTVDTALSQSKEIAEQYQLAVQGSQMAEARVNRLLLDFNSGISFEMTDLVSALQDKASNDVKQVDSQYAYLTLQAQMDFLTYSGAYASLLTEKQP